MEPCIIFAHNSRMCERGSKGCSVMHSPKRDECHRLAARLAEVERERDEAQQIIKERKHHDVTIEKLQAVREQMLAFATSTATAAAKERDCARWADETRQKVCLALIADRNEWRTQHENALACWDVDRRNLASKVAATESRLVNTIIERDSALQSLAQQDEQVAALTANLATMTARAVAAESLAAERYVAIEDLHAAMGEPHQQAPSLVERLRKEWEAERDSLRSIVRRVAEVSNGYWNDHNAEDHGRAELALHEIANALGDPF